MADAPASPVRTGFLWAFLSLLLLSGLVLGILGTVAVGVALSGVWAPLYLPLGVVGLVAAIYLFYLTMGIVYRLDRLRGNLTRRIALFE